VVDEVVDKEKMPDQIQHILDQAEANENVEKPDFQRHRRFAKNEPSLLEKVVLLCVLLLF